MTDKETARLVFLAVAAYPNMQEREMRPTVDVWYRLLGHLPFPVAEAALSMHLVKSHFFPSPADLLEQVDAIVGGQLPDPVEAWEEVVREIHRVGYMGSPTFSSDVIKRAVKVMGGWWNLCASEQPQIDRAQFLKLYENLSRRERDVDKLPPQVRELAAGLGERLALPPGGRAGDA